MEEMLMNIPFFQKVQSSVSYFTNYYSAYIKLSEYSDFVWLSPVDDIVYVEDTVWNDWGGEDLIIGNSEVIQLYLEGAYQDYSLKKSYNSVFESYNGYSNDYNAVRVTKNGPLPGYISLIGFEALLRWNEV